MNASIHAPRDGDARLADARRFVSDVEVLLADARPGGAPPGLARISGLDHTGTAYAVVDPVGRFVDIGLTAGWWPVLGPDRVAAGLLEALASARMKAALVPFLLRRPGTPPVADRLGTPPAPAGLGTPPAPARLGTPPVADRLGTPPVADRLGTPPTPAGPGTSPAVGRLGAPPAAGWSAATPVADFLDVTRARMAEAGRLIDNGGDRPHEVPAEIITGPRGLIRLHVRGGRIDRAEAGPHRCTAADTDRLAADARDALAELARSAARCRAVTSARLPQ